MRLPILMLCLLAVFSSVPVSAQAQEVRDSVPQGQSAIEDPALEEVALQWLALLREEAFDSAAAQVAPAARRQFSGDQLAEMWIGLLGRFGELGEMEPGERTQSGSFAVLRIVGSFERAERTLQVSFDAQGRVAGFVVTARR